MRRQIPSFPFPNLKSQIENKQIFNYANDYTDWVEKNRNYERKISSATSNIKNQYLYIEDELLRSFQYVQPTTRNLNTSSVRFASIIRESANLYEIISKSVYRQIFDIQERDTININNFLSLDFFLDLGTRVLYSPILYGEFNGSDILQPFKSLVSWNKNSPIVDTHIPKWWTAYNKVKHDINGINDFATLENALSSLGALYIIIDRVYGEGVIGGILKKPISKNNFSQHLCPFLNCLLKKH